MQSQTSVLSEHVAPASLVIYDSQDIFSFSRGRFGSRSPNVHVEMFTVSKSTRVLTLERDRVPFDLGEGAGDAGLLLVVLGVQFESLEPVGHNHVPYIPVVDVSETFMELIE